jgi:glycosyltransferase involved in cell wall biosynthesis
VNSESGKRYIEKFGNLFISVIPQTSSFAIPIYASDSNPNSCRKNQWVYVGRMVKEKGLVEFIEAFSKVSGHKPNLLFVGDGPDSNEIQLEASNRKVNATFVGWKNEDWIRDEMDKSKFLILPSYSDEWGLVVIEAIARGLPVLGSIYTGAIRELEDKGNFSITFDVHEEQSLRQAIIAALNMKSGHWEEMHLESFRVFESEDLNDNKTAKRFASVIESLALNENSKNFRK